MRLFYKLIALCYFLIVQVGVYAKKWIPIDCSEDSKPMSFEIVESSFSSYKVRFVIHGLYDDLIVNNNGSFHRLSLGNDAHLSNTGEPALPVIAQLVAIPNGGEYSVSIDQEKWIDVDMGTIYPAQKCLLEKEERLSFSMDTVAYSKDYTPSIVSRGEEMEWRGVRNVNMLICPFIYHPQANKLSVLCEFILKVDYSKSDKQHREITGDVWKLFDNHLQKTEEKTFLTNTHNYLIIVGSNSILNSQELKEFQRWKAYRGYRTKVVSTSSIGSTTNSIKSYIAQEYNNGIRYVLLVGDDDEIPLKSVISATGRSVKSDYWYGCIGGDSDVEADVAIGRFSTNSLEEFRNMVNKTIKYEKDYSATNEVILVANKENAPGEYQGCCETIRNAVYNTPLSFTKLYGASPYYGGTSATNSEVCSQINAGVHIVNYRGHGDYNLWWNWNTSNQDFVDSEINNINDSVSAVFFSIACQTADIHNQTCMMETFTRSSNGAVAFLGATEDSYTIANHTYDQHLFKKLLNDGVFLFGDLNMAAHIQNFSINGNYAKDNAFCYLCGGDPSLEIWTDIPRNFGDIEFTNVGDSILIRSVGINDYKYSIVDEDGALLEVNNTTNGLISVAKPTIRKYVVLNKHNYYPCVILIDAYEMYIQNRVFDYSALYLNNSYRVGYDVYGYPYGDVIVKPGRTLKFVTNNDVYIKNGFECEKGAVLEIKCD